MKNDRWVNWDTILDENTDPYKFLDKQEDPDMQTIRREHALSMQERSRERAKNVVPEDDYIRLGLTPGDVRWLSLSELVLNYGLTHDKAVELRHRAFNERREVVA